jgi:hypothetical protein
MNLKKAVAAIIAVSSLFSIGGANAFAEANDDGQGTSTSIVFHNYEEVTPLNFYRQPRMGVFEDVMYNEGLYTKNLVTTKSGELTYNVGFLPNGAYVDWAQAGIIQGSSSNYSQVVYDGTRTAQLLNNPLQSQYRDSTWSYHY